MVTREKDLEAEVEAPKEKPVLLGMQRVYDERMSDFISFRITPTQEKAFKELVERTGSEMSPSLFCRAMLLEGLRDDGILGEGD